MLPQFGQLGFDDRAAGGGVAATLRVGLSTKPAVLGRQTIVLIALGGIAAIVYGTLVPFNFAATRSFAWHLPLHAPSSGDFTSNIITYVPMGIFLRLLFRRRGSWWLAECAAASISAATISYATEVLQSLLPSRVPSLTDTLANTGGAMIGVLLAPLFQRQLRQFHAWLYANLRTRPFAVAAGLATACICLYAITPFDVHPVPGFVAGRFKQLCQSFQDGLTGGYGLGTADLAAKTLGAASYGILAFLLVIARRERGRPVSFAGGYGLSRSIALAGAIETLQLFTISHAADWRDFELAVVACVTATVLAVVVLWCRPLIYRDPIAMVGPTLPLLGAVCIGWAFAVTVQTVSGGRGGAIQWLPIMGSFNQPWDSLVTGYAASFLNYALIAGVAAVWWRGRHRAPTAAACVAVAVVAAVTLQGAAMLLRGVSADTGHLLLAIVAGLTAQRLDRAICGHISRTQPRLVATSRVPIETSTHMTRASDR